MTPELSCFTSVATRTNCCANKNKIYSDLPDQWTHSIFCMHSLVLFLPLIVHFEQALLKENFLLRVGYSFCKEEPYRLI